MKITTVLITLALILSACNAEKKTTELKLMTYNTHNGIGLDHATDYQRIGELIKNYNPDIVALQELDSVTVRSEGKYVLGEIATTAGYHPFYAPAIDYQGGKYGIGILSKETPDTIRQISMPGREEERTLIIAEFPEYIFACTHLSLTEEDRLASLKILNDLAQGCEKPFFLAGDLNDEPSSQFIDSLNEKFTPLNDITAHTFPANRPEVTIDYILAYKNDGFKVSVDETEVISDTIKSDHRPVILTATITQ